MARCQQRQALLIPALIVCVAAMEPRAAEAQDGSSALRVTQIASATTGSISGVVLDDRGQPLDGVIVSALGATSAFAVSDRVGQFTLRSLTPGPYLLRAHMQGYLPARNAMVSVRPSARTVSSFTLRREGKAPEPHIAAAGVGGIGETEVSAAPESEKARDESETSWRLRHLKRSILKDATTFVEVAAAQHRDWTDSFELLGRAVESSARMAGSLFSNVPWQGQVNLLTTGAFDSPFQLLQLERTHSVAFFAVGAPVGLHGDWTVKAALNQGDLSSWILAGNYARRGPTTHRYEFGMSYGLHRYEGGNLAAMTLPESARNVGSVHARDEWRLSKHVTLGYGANYAHYDYLGQPSHLSPRITATFVAPDENMRIRAVAARQVTAPGAEEFLPPTHAHVLPPQRTFAPLTRDVLVPEDLQHYEVELEQSFDGATLGLRAFQQSVENQLVTVFGFRTPDAPPAQLGHYFVASAGDVAVHGVGVSFTREVAGYLRGAVDYSFAAAEWTANGRAADLDRLLRRLPSAVRNDLDIVHDLTTSLETIVPQTATRVFFVVKMNNAYIRDDGNDDRPGLERRFDVQISQGLPFMDLFKADWEMVIGVRNLFRESLTESSIYDELLVARPPKRLIGGLTVKF